MKNDDLIKKWLSNTLTPSEKEAFNKLNDASFNTEIINEAKRFKASSNYEAPCFETFSKQLNHKATPFKLQWKKVAPQLVAALLISAVFIYFFATTTKPVVIATQIAQQQTVALPDDSKVILNAKSNITYTKSEWKNNRSLTLEGEAFFDVKKGSTFDVITPLGKISVLGTEFNVKQRLDYFEVYCFEGLVEVTFNNKIIKLPAGKAFTARHGVTSKFAILETKPQWSKTISKFKNTPINEVFNELERHYPISVDYSQINSSQTFTGAFEHQNLNNALLAITKPLKLTYKKKQDHFIILETTRE